MTVDPQRAQSLFLAAHELLDPTARRALLDRECAGDDELRQRVAALLSAHDATAGFGNEPSGRTHDATVNSALNMRAGEQIGRFKLIESIGEGGMGTVWVADQQEPVRRKVAIKLIKAGMDSRQVLARFEAERQALAMMDHPNIARVFDGGMTEQGRPYFVMEYVKGIPLTEYCDQAKLSLEERLDLFMPVCQAVQHAHQKGIVHRDLKPSNILICLYDGNPVPKVIDFGLAKAMHQSLTDQSLHTAHGMMVGTPLYMSPEQAEHNNLDVDTRTDIYSLGVILYELLTGTTPLERQQLKEAAYNEVLRLIKEVEPPKPSTRLSGSDSLPSIAAQRSIEPRQLGKSLTGDLDWIVMKALDKERSRRYETANGLARDIDRYLSDEAVDACPPTAAYRFQKFVKRNRGQVIAASMVLLALVIGIAGTTWGWLEAKHQQQLAEKARQAEAERSEGERQAKQEAEKKRLEAERSLAIARKGNEILGSVFAGLDPKMIAESDRPLQDVLRENLMTSVKELEGTAIGSPVDVARMQATLGNSLMGLGEYKLGIEVLEKAAETIKSAPNPHINDKMLCLSALSKAYVLNGEVGKALDLAEELAEATKILDSDDINRLLAIGTLGVSYQHCGQHELAIPYLEEALKLMKAKHPDDHNLLKSMGHLGQSYLHAGNLKEAIPLLEETHGQMMLKLDSKHPDIMTSMKVLSDAYRIDGQSEKSIELLEQALELEKINLGPDHPETLDTMRSLADAYSKEGRDEENIAMLEQAVELSRENDGFDDQLQTSRIMHNLGLAYCKAGEFDKALTLFEETVKRLKAELGTEHFRTWKSMSFLAMTYQLSGKNDQAFSAFMELFKWDEKLHQEPFKEERADLIPQVLLSSCALAVTYWKANQLDKAIPLFEETLRMQKAELGRDHANTLMTLGNLGVNYMDAGRLKEAIPLLEEASLAAKAHPQLYIFTEQLAVAYDKAGMDDKLAELPKPASVPGMNQRAVAYWREKQFDKAIMLFEEILELQETELGRGNLATQRTVANLGVNYRDAGRLTEAIPLLEEANRAAKRYPSLRWVTGQLANAYDNAGENAKLVELLQDQVSEARKSSSADGELASWLAQLGMGLLQQEQWSDAEPHLRECLDIRKKTAPDAWTTFNTQSMLGGALLGQEKFDEAKPLLLSGYQGMKDREATIPEPGRIRLTEACKRLIEFYTATDKPDEAAKQKSELDELKVNEHPSPQ